MTTSINPPPSLLNKVPEVTLSFWIIKIKSTTVGETGADFLAVNAGWGQAATRSVMSALLVLALVLQMRTRRYTPWICWLTVVHVSVVGTQITDLLTDGWGVSLYASTAAFAATLAVIFGVWHRLECTLSITDIVTRRRESFYWVAILCTFALGTAAGDLATEALGLGFAWGAVAFGALIAVSYGARRLGGPAVLTFCESVVARRSRSVCPPYGTPVAMPSSQCSAPFNATQVRRPRGTDRGTESAYRTTGQALLRLTA